MALIEMDALIKDLSYAPPELLADRDYLFAKIRRQHIVEMPTVVHGCWKEKYWTTDYDWGCTNHRSIVCSVCNAEIYQGLRTPYCPFCGAPMDLEV